MNRILCVDVPALPLQMLLRAHPDWVLRAVAVVSEDTPQGVVLWLNDAARRAGIRKGLRYAAALGFCTELRAGVVDAARIETCIGELVDRLRRFSPAVEPCADEAGVFWLEGRGLQGHYRTPRAWADALHRDVRGAGWDVAVVCGYGKFAAYAVAKALPEGDARRRAWVLRSPAEEEAALRRVPLDRVGIEPQVRDALLQLGVRSVGDFVHLPAAGLLRRYDAATYRLHRMAAGTLELPLHSRLEIEPVRTEADLDPPEMDLERLQFRIKQLLDPLLDRLEREGRALMGLEVQLEFERGAHAPVTHRIRPASPTLDAVQLLGLLRLRLEAVPLPCGTAFVALEVEPTPARHEQLSLFTQKPKRDLRAAARALARLRAAYGDDAVVRARLTEGHLPEARFIWEPLAKPAALGVGKAAVAAGGKGPAMGSPAADAPALFLPGVESSAVPAPARVLVRKIHTKPQPLPPRPPHEPDGCLLRGLDHGPVARFLGPYVISGAWWRGEVQREYYVAEMRNGDLLWVFYDRRRRQWFLHGQVS